MCSDATLHSPGHTSNSELERATVRRKVPAPDGSVFDVLIEQGSLHGASLVSYAWELEAARESSMSELSVLMMTESSVGGLAAVERRVLWGAGAERAFEYSMHIEWGGGVLTVRVRASASLQLAAERWMLAALTRLVRQSGRSATEPRNGSSPSWPARRPAHQPHLIAVL